MMDFIVPCSLFHHVFFTEPALLIWLPDGSTKLFCLQCGVWSFYCCGLRLARRGGAAVRTSGCQSGEPRFESSCFEA